MELKKTTIPCGETRVDAYWIGNRFVPKTMENISKKCSCITGKYDWAFMIDDFGQRDMTWNHHRIMHCTKCKQYDENRVYTKEVYGVSSVPR